MALAYTGPDMRDALRNLLEFDARLARIVSATTEPMLGQMRLAWWRDTLGRPVHERPAGDAVLDALGARWDGGEAALIALTDGWERMLEEPPLTQSSARAFAEARCEAMLAAHGVSHTDSESAAFHTTAWRWALADFAAQVSRDDERDGLVKLGLGDGAPNPRLPRHSRGLAVLGALGLRSLRAGGRPLMEGRGAAAVALKAAVFGR